MSQYLPYSGFKWLSREKINRFDVNSIEENSPIGYILKADLEYPDDLYPLAPEKFEVSHLSQYVVKLL